MNKDEAREIVTSCGALIEENARRIVDILATEPYVISKRLKDDTEITVTIESKGGAV